MDDILCWLTRFVVEIALIGTGKAVIAIVTLGRWRGERVSHNEGRIHSPAGALSFKHEGRRVITAAGLFFVGVLFYVAVVCLLIWLPSRP